MHIFTCQISKTEKWKIISVDDRKVKKKALSNVTGENINCNSLLNVTLSVKLEMYINFDQPGLLLDVYSINNITHIQE